MARQETKALLKRRADGSSVAEFGDVRIRMDRPVPGDRSAPWDEDGHWPHYHYVCTLRKGSRRMTVHFFVGTLHGPPHAAELLDCLLSDASSIEEAGGSVREWSDNLGYEEVTPDRVKQFRGATRQTERLKQFLGEHYEMLLWKWSGDWKEVTDEPA